MLAGPGAKRHPYFHCGTEFDHPRSRASNMKYCSKRLSLAKIPLNNHTHRRSSRSDADVPIDLDLQAGRAATQCRYTAAASGSAA